MSHAVFFFRQNECTTLNNTVHPRLSEPRLSEPRLSEQGSPYKIEILRAFSRLSEPL